MGRLKALLSQPRQTDATRDATTRQEGLGHLSHVAPLRECDTRQRGDADLMALVDRVASHYRTPPGEVAEMKRIALADRAAAWDTFTATVAGEGIR